MAFAASPFRLPFSKFEGLGNDFVVIDLRNLDPRDPIFGKLQARAASICDRRRGVGADGLLLVGPAQDPSHHASMIVINADGSRPEMCGNGLRCVAHFLSAGRNQSLWVETDNGPLHCEVSGASGSCVQVRVAMGSASIAAIERPAGAPDREFLSVSMGNPHAITWVEADEDPKRLAETLGPIVEVDGAYPERTNVEFVKDTPGGLVCWVWERGCGITLACGTGACATAAAAVHRGVRRAGEVVRVELPGGVLDVVVPGDEGDSVLMVGGSCWVFSGVLGVEGLR